MLVIEFTKVLILSGVYHFGIRVLSCGSKENIDPSYLEIAFNNICNFKCAYCDPTSSTSWFKEMQTHGSYPISDKFHDIKDNVRPFKDDSEDNPYTDAFWKWWPTLYEKLVFFRITGGEPLLSKHTWKVLDFIEKKPRKNLNFSINTNMGVHEHTISKLIEKINLIAPNINAFEIYTSCESYGKQTEYTRFGMNFEQFLKNNYYLLENTINKVQLHFMITFNLLSFSTFQDFLLEIKKMRKKFSPDVDSTSRIHFRINYLTHPFFLSAQIASHSLKERYCKEFAEFANEQSLLKNKQVGFLYETEIDQIERLISFISTPVKDPYLKNARNNFRKFINEYDRRRKTSFNSLFSDPFFEKSILKSSAFSNNSYLWN